MSTKLPLVINNLNIRKMPGFPQGLDGYDQLAPGINVIAGPNASGKSSTARVIQKIIWRNSTDGFRADASLSAGSEAWEISIDSMSASIRHNGREEELAGLPPSESRSRYILALHELVTENESDLARRIIKESIGGYDPDEARKTLEYSPLVRNKKTTEYQAFEEAIRHLRMVDRKHSALKDEERWLEDLYNQKDAAENALRLKDLFEKAVTFLEAEQHRLATSERLKIFPEVLEKISGHEYDQIMELDGEIQTIQIEIERSRTMQEENNRSLSLLRIPVTGVGDDVLNDLESRIEKLTRLERDLAENLELQEKARIREREALKCLGGAIDPVDWDGADLSEVLDLDEFLQSSHQLISDKVQWESRIKEMKSSLGEEDVHPPETLSEGIRALSNWLQEGEGKRRIPVWIIPIMILISIVTGFLAFFAGWFWIAGPVLALMAGLIAARQLSQTGKKSIRKGDFNKTGLPGPHTWSADDVAKKLGELIEELGQAKWRERAEVNIAEYSSQLKKLDEQLAIVNKTRDEWMKKLKAAPDSYSGLYWFLVHIRKWQESHEESEIREAKTLSLNQDISSQLKHINDLLIISWGKEVIDATGAKAVYNVIRSMETRRRELVKDSDMLIRNIASMEEKMGRDKVKLKELYQQTGIGEGNSLAVKQLTAQLSDYRSAKKDLDLVTGLAAEKKQLLEKHPLFNEYIAIPGNIDLETARNNFRKYEEVVRDLDELKRNIHTIEANVERTKKEHDLEDALAGKDAALEKLGDLFRENLSSATGNLIVDQLKLVTSEQNRPGVYKRAGELLNRITCGRYELRLEEKDDPAFQAYDTKYRIVQALGELSTGTRIQLLIAVRLAFIETQEPVMKLPLLADELLANSDDIRAAAVIEALTEISREGRQIFYFTAQDDEVARWKQHLKDSSNGLFRIIRLTGRSHEMVPEASVYPIPAFIHQIPSPGKMDHDTYRKKLEVQVFSIMNDHPAQLHLWYLTEDDQLIYRLLSGGLTCFGQLESFLNHGGKVEGLTTEKWQEMKKQKSPPQPLPGTLPDRPAKTCRPAIIGAIRSHFPYVY